MNYPNIITNKFLASVASPTEQMMVRLIIRHVANNSVYNLHGRKNRHYHFEFNRQFNAHILDVPLSVWMDGVNTAVPAQDNASIAWDLMNKKHSFGSPILIVVPWPNAKALEQRVDAETPATSPRLSAAGRKAVESIDGLAGTLKAPEIVHRAIALVLADDLTDEDLAPALEDIQLQAEDMMRDDPDLPASDESPSIAVTAPEGESSEVLDAKRKQANEKAKERMRKLRERKAAAKKAPAKKAARKVATKTEPAQA